MTPYNHLRSQHCNASWRGQFMNISQLAPHTTFNTQLVWPCGGSRPSRVETFPRFHPETTFQIYKHFDNRSQLVPEMNLRFLHFLVQRTNLLLANCLYFSIICRLIQVPFIDAVTLQGTSRPPYKW